MPLQSGHVVKVWDHLTHPQKFKRHICVCPDKQLFLRINSEPIFPPHLLIKVDATTPFLEHDSYVELQQMQRLQALYIQQAEHLGALTQTHKVAILIALDNGGWMTPDIADFIREKFGLAPATTQPPP